MNWPFLKVNPFLHYDKGHILQWSLDPTFKDAAPYSFTLQASETPSFSDLIFEQNVGNSFYAVDATKRKQSWQNSYIYRVKLETGSDKVYYSSNINHNTSEMDTRKYLTAAEMTRKEVVMMHYQGRPAYLLKRKGYGQVATQEVDPVSGVVLTDNPVDFGTGLVGGYHQPLGIYYQASAEREEAGLHEAGYGSKSVKQITARLIGFPFVDTKDVIVSREDERFLIQKVGIKKFPGTNVIILQTIEMSRIANTDSIYKLQMP